MNEFQIKESFYLNGKPFQILSGAIHYFRIPRAYWEDSLYNLKAMGFNTVETYIPWNIHEPQPGKFDFSEQYDVAGFVRLAQRMGLWVIVRPTPFICAEWEFGGLPAWLLREGNVQVRTNTPAFLDHVTRYYRALFEQIAPLQITRGGPVLMMQVENEYGSFSNDQEYLRSIARIMRGCGAEVPLFTSDGAWDAALEAGSLIEDGILPTGNFGSHADDNLDAMERFFARHGKQFPLMCMEFWDGWFNRWGEEIIKRDADDLAQEVETLLKRASINLYMFQGGTNFGFFNGCSARGERDLPQITSYDYDAVLTEWGAPTDKFYKIQQVVQKLFPEIETFPPRDRTRTAYAAAQLRDRVALDACKDALTDAQESTYPLTMEQAGSGYGYMLYETEVLGFGQEMKLKVPQAADRVQIFLNGTHLATQYREQIGQEVTALFPEGCSKLQVLVENMGRVNYGYKLHAPSQSKGIRTGVMVDIHFESGWKNYALTLEDPAKIDFSGAWQPGVPAFYRYTFDVYAAQDTFLDCSTLGKGVVFLNGRNLGRYWNIGPVQYLYLPGAWMHPGQNELIVFETEQQAPEALEFSAQPRYCAIEA